jgi:hypothetical protein
MIDPLHRTADEEEFLDMRVGDLLSRRRTAERLIEGRRLTPLRDAGSRADAVLHYGQMTVVLIKSGDPTVVVVKDGDEESWAEIDVAGDDPERIEELQAELDRAYLHRNENL